MERTAFLFRDAIDAMDISLWEIDRNYKVISLNRKAAEMFGENRLGEHCFRFAAERESVCPECPAVKIFDGTPNGRAEVRHVDANGKYIYLDHFAAPLKDKDGKLTGALVLGMDITRYKTAEESLRISEEKYRELVQTANSIILRRDPEGRITFFNEFAQKFFGYSEKEILSRNVIGAIIPEKDCSGRDLTCMVEDIGKDPEKYKNNENENMLRSGERVWIAWTNKAVRDADGKVMEILCVGNDITARKKAEETLLHLSSIDGLTGLKNRLAFNKSFDEEWRRALRSGYRISVMMIDIDFFKQYNDSYGHLTGDECVVSVADVLKGTTRRPGDMVARFGGDEFVILLPMTEAQNAADIAEKIRSRVESLKIPHRNSGISDYVTLSIGVVTIMPRQEISLVDLIKQADEALYKAKSEGRNKVVHVDAR